MTLLTSEIEKLDAHGAIAVRVDVERGGIRRDGMLRAAAKVRFPGVVVSFESRFGPLSYATDAYDHWQANVRAIALSLRALRAVDRYGVSRSGEQYVGWRALEASPIGVFFDSASDALFWLRTEACLIYGKMTVVDTFSVKNLVRAVSKTVHPDVNNGNREKWDRLEEAKLLFQRADMML